VSTHKRSKKLFLASIIATLGLGTGQAWSDAGASDTPNANSPDIQEVTVSAKKLEEEVPQELAKYGTRVVTIDAKQLAEGGYTDLGQALSTIVPGLYLNQKNGPFDYVDASFQGSRTEDILWLVDGVRINNRLYGGTTPLDTIPASMIERIEVIEGGQALFYGTQAIAGAINIVTKAFTDNSDGKVTIAADTNTGKHGDAYARDSYGKSQFVVYVSADKSDGFQPFRDQDYQPSGTDHGRAYDVLTTGIKYAYNFNDNVRLSIDEQHTDANLDFARAFIAAHEFNERSEDLATMKLDVKFSDALQLFVKPYYHLWWSHVTQYNNTIPPSDTLTVLFNAAAWGYYDYGTNVLTQFKPGGPLEYFAGYDLQRYAGSDAALVITRHTESTNAVFGQIRTSDDFSKDLRLSAGFRYSEPSFGQSATVWTVTGQYNFTPNLFMRGQVGTSFRLPTDEELFANDPNDERGDPNLKPEKGTNLNLSVGGSGQLGQAQTNWELIGFYRQINNLIDYLSFDATTNQAVFGNVPGTVKTKGGEITYDVTLAPTFKADFSYTYADVSDSETGQPVSRIPKNLVKAEADYQSPSHWGGTLTLNYFGTTYQTGLWDGTETYGDALVVDATVRYYIDSDHHHQRIDATVQNLFDKQYATGLGTGVRDADGTNYTFWNLGVPRTLRLAYTYTF
jgi:vitamin B12 transporter